MLIKLCKWVYALGYRKGYDDAIQQNRIKFYKPRADHDDEDFIKEIDEVMQNESLQS